MEENLATPPLPPLGKRTRREVERVRWDEFLALLVESTGGEGRFAHLDRDATEPVVSKRHHPLTGRGDPNTPADVLSDPD